VTKAMIVSPLRVMSQVISCLVSKSRILWERGWLQIIQVSKSLNKTDFNGGKSRGQNLQTLQKVFIGLKVSPDEICEGY